MSKFVYLFGAGASYGKRDSNNDIIEGLPIVDEFSAQIQRFMSKIITESPSQRNFLSRLRNPDKAEVDIDHIDENEYRELIDELDWLKLKSESHKTIDTYAKKLFITNDKDYDRLKNILSAYLTLEQLYNKPDLRYDAFWATLFGRNINQLPEDISIFSWNYDCQFELSYSNYLNDGKSIDNIWEALNITCKSKRVNNSVVSNKGFSITKLNGSALMINSKKTLLDPFFDKGKASFLKYVSQFYVTNEYKSDLKNILSFAWDETDEDYWNKIHERSIDTEILVIIGYSFPYFNRNIDRKIIQNMKSLKKVYIQDPNCEDVKESFEATLSEEQLNKVENREIKIVPRKYTTQFLIPNEM